MSEAGPVSHRGTGLPFFRRRLVWIGLGIGLVLALGGMWAITALQKSRVFPRALPSLQQPAARIAAGGEVLWFDIDGARVEAWFLPATAVEPAPLVIHAHGSGELIDIQTQSVVALRATGIGVLLVEYPGYGRSSGEPSEESITAAFIAAYDWASRDSRVDATRIIGYGRSLGGGAIAQLAAHRPLAALVLESTFVSLDEMVRAKGIPGWLVVNEFDTRSVLANYPGPVLILHGTRDGTFSTAHAHALHKASPRSTLLLQDCAHNDCPLQWDLVRRLFVQDEVSNAPVPGESP